MRRLLAVLWLTLLGLAAYPADVSARPDADAVRIFNDGRRLFDKGKHAEALKKFENTLALADSPNARLYLARCLHELGRSVEAYEQMQRTMADASARDDPKYTQTRDIAAARLALIEKEIGRLMLSVPDADGQTTVKVGEREIPSEALGKPVPVKPGSVVVTATKPDAPEVRRQVEVKAGDLLSVTLDFAKPEQPAPEPSQPPPPPEKPDVPEPDEEPGIGALTVTGIVLAAVGVAGMVAFGVTGAMALDKHKTIEDECGGVPCAELSYNDEIDDGQTMQLVANVSLGVGAGALAVGATLIVIGVLTADDDTQSDSGAVVHFGPEGGYLGYSVEF